MHVYIMNDVYLGAVDTIVTDAPGCKVVRRAVQWREEVQEISE